MRVPDGYSDIPPGKLASIVTCLHMLAPVSIRAGRIEQLSCRLMRRLEENWKNARLCLGEMRTWGSISAKTLVFSREFTELHVLIGC